MYCRVSLCIAISLYSFLFDLHIYSSTWLPWKTLDLHIYSSTGLCCKTLDFHIYGSTGSAQLDLHCIALLDIISLSESLVILTPQPFHSQRAAPMDQVIAVRNICKLFHCHGLGVPSLVGHQNRLPDLFNPTFGSPLVFFSKSVYLRAPTKASQMGATPRTGTQLQ